MFLRIKNSHRPYKYWSYFLSFNRDLSTTLLLIIYLLTILLVFDSYSLLIIPFLLAPSMVYAIQGGIAYNYDHLVITNLVTVHQIMEYIYSLLIAADYTNGDSHGNNYTSTCHLLTIYSAHIQTCENPECACKMIENQLNSGPAAVYRGLNNNNNQSRYMLSKGRLIDRKTWILFIRQQLNDILSKNSKEAKLFILAAYLEYYWLNNSFMALTLLAKAEDLHPSIYITMSIMHLRREIEDLMISKQLMVLKGNDANANKTLFDARKINKFMKLYNKFMEEVESCTSSNIAFWTILLDDTPDTRKLNNVGNNISTYLKKLHTLYIKIMEADSSNINFLYKYGIFLRCIAFDELTANTIFTKIKTLREKREIRRKTEYDLFSMKGDKLVVMRISGNKNSLGKILDVNFETTTQLKFGKNELLGTYLKRLFPSVIAARHDDWMLNSYSKLIFPTLNRISHGFVCDKVGYFIMVNFLVKIIPNLKDGINFIGAMQPNKHLNGLIQTIENVKAGKRDFGIFICDEVGRIIGINHAAGKYFGMQPREFSSHGELIVQTIFPFLNDLHVEEKAKSKEGYYCDVDFEEIIKQAGDSDRQEVGIDFNTKSRRVDVWIRIIDEIYGEKVENVCKLRLVVILPIASKRDHTNNSQQPILEDEKGSNFFEGEQSHEKENREHRGADMGSISGSITTSSQTSTTSDANSIREFKASLYERKNPFTVRLLRYSIWLLYSVLLISCAIDWIISVIKANDTENLFDLVNLITQRLHHVSTISHYTRTIDLVDEGSEINQYFGNLYFKETGEHVFF